MHKITTCARHLTHQDSWISWQVLWCLYLYRFFLSRYDSDAMFFSSRQYARVSNTHTHTPSLMYYQLFVPYRWYTEIKPYSDYIHLSESCITSIIMLYQTFHHLLSDAQHLHPWCIKWWIILCATYYPRSTGIHIYICISNERVIINISKFIFIPMLAQCW